MSTKKEVKELRHKLPLFDDAMGLVEDLTGKTDRKRHRKHKNR